jgi:hypothetical protein
MTMQDAIAGKTQGWFAVARLDSKRFAFAPIERWETDANGRRLGHIRHECCGEIDSAEDHPGFVTYVYIAQTAPLDPDLVHGVALASGDLVTRLLPRH